MARDSFNLPHGLVRTTIEMRGEEGKTWLRRLPEIIAGCARRWSLTVEPPFPELSFNFAAPAVRADGAATVLKVCFPDKEFFTEAEALRLVAGEGMVRLIEVDLDLGALLLERVEPGTPIDALADDRAATSAAASVLRRIWRPAPLDHRFPTVADWVAGLGRLRRRFDGGTGPLPAALVEEAERRFADLLASSPPPVLLHGDLHHGNVLAARREPWLAIDPKGVVGDPAFDTYSLLHNPESLLTEPSPGRTLARRIDQLAEELGLDRARVRDWGISGAVLSAWWTVEDSDQVWDLPVICARLLAEIKR
jgi:streptomycin 6-kinase